MGTLFPDAALLASDPVARLDRRCAVGLYFAVRKAAVGEGKVSKQAVVWAIDPSILNKRVLGWQTIALPGWKEVQPWLPKDPYGAVLARYPIAVDPVHVDVRLAVQRSHFTLFGSEKDGLRELASRRKGRKIRLARIVISGRKRIRKIVERLETSGIRETTVFPDLEGLSREIKGEWRK
jgi:hypothetical protein